MACHKLAGNCYISSMMYDLTENWQDAFWRHEQEYKPKPKNSIRLFNVICHYIGYKQRHSDIIINTLNDLIKHVGPEDILNQRNIGDVTIQEYKTFLFEATKEKSETDCMIKANELRIGTLIKRKSNGSICTVNWGIIKDFDLNIDVKDYEPIELTEEWLFKFGFENKINVYQLKVGHNFYFTYAQGKMYLSTIATDGNLDVFLAYDKYYVHQIQNLYFALTGSELSVSSHLVQP